MTKSILIKGCLCAFGCEALWGLGYIFTKQATAEASILSLLGWRFLIAFILMHLLVWAGFLKIRLKSKNLKPLWLLALFNPVLYFLGETIGISETTASESGVFIACIPVVCLLASTFLLNKRPTVMQTVGVLVTLMGVLCTVLSKGMASSLSSVGYVLLMVAILSYALYEVQVVKLHNFTSIEITYIMLLSGAVIFGSLALGEALISGELMSFVHLPFVNFSFLTAILYLAIYSSILAFFLANVALSSIGVNLTSTFIGVSTLVGVFSGVLYLHETFTLWQSLGGALIILGVYIANHKTRVDEDPADDSQNQSNNLSMP
ncbi:MAG: DMT family transporter [Succinivibrio sp.]|nr:DMT family transporter [Succinivibrio sp.]